MHRLIVRRAKQVVTVCENGEKILKGNAMNNVCVLEGTISIVINSEGLIEDLGEDETVMKKYNSKMFEKEIDATGMCVVPGLVDGHSHPVFAGDRVHEFAMKLAGASYLDVHKAGGGIHFTVDHVCKATEDKLYENLKEIFQRMLRAGTTLVEAKSGYGLDTVNEIKMLKVIERAKHDEAIEISSTFCGAHAVPKGSTAAEAATDIINNQLPKVKALMDSGELHVDNIDVFCEKGVFELTETERILTAGKNIGLAINFHAEELNQLKSVELGVSLGARAISHLEEVSDEGIKALAVSSTVAVVLPTTAYILKLTPPPVRKLIQEGAAVALGSDFNPNAFCLSMPIVMNLACVTFGMTMNEALVASTINAAASVGLSKSHGSLEVGKVGDMVVIDCPRAVSYGKCWACHTHQGFGTDEQVLINILCVQSNEGLKSIKSSFRKEFEKELPEVIGKETSGDFQSLLLKVLQADRDESQAAIAGKVKSDAKALHEAGVKKNGTDESKFIDILVSRSRSHMRQVFEEYKQIANQEIEHSIKTEMSGDLEESLLSLVSFIRKDPEVYWSSRLNRFINKPKELLEYITERSEIDMLEIKEEYKKAFKVTLADDIKKNYSGSFSKILLALIKELSFSPKPPSSNAPQRTPRGRATKLSRTASTPPPPKATDVATFHGTVVAAKEFDVNQDVKTFHLSFGKDRNAIILLLSSRSNLQRQAIAAKYEETHEKDLVTTVNQEFQVKSASFVRSLFISPAANDARILQEAMEGLGTKEKILIHILCQRSEQEIQEVKNQYKQAYNKSLAQSINSETDGNFGKLLLEILKCDRDDSTVVDAKIVEADVKGLFEAGEKKLGTDEDKFIETLTARSYSHLCEVFKEYEKVSDEGFEKVLRNEFSGDIGDALLTLVSCVKNPQMYYVNKLKETVEKDVDTFSKLVVERCEIDMVTLKELYQKTYQKQLSDDIKKHFEEDLKSILLALIKEWSPNDEETQLEVPIHPPIVYHATVLTSPNFVAEDNVNTLEEQFGKDKITIVDILTTRTTLQRQSISEAYQRKVKQDLLQKLIREFGEESKDILSLLMQANSKSDAEKLHDAMEGFGTKESVLIDILCRRTAQEIATIKIDYKQTYEKDLEETVRKETSGDLNKLLIQLIKCERVETSTVNVKLVEQDAAELHNAGEKMTGTDESPFIDIFATRNVQHLRLVFEHYKKISGKTIEDTLHVEFSGDIETALITLVSYANDPLTQLVVKLNLTVKEDPGTFCQLVVERSEVDMVEIKELYQASYGASLADDIKKYYAGDVKNILLGLIKEWFPEKEESNVREPTPVIYHATVVGSPTFNVDDDLNTMKQSLGKDKNAIVAILTTRNRRQRQEISEKFQLEHKEDLYPRLIAEFGEEYREILSQLIHPLAVTDVELLYDAMKGSGTKEEVLISVLCRRSQQEITSVKMQYKNTYGKDLLEMVDEETSGDLNKLLIQLIKCDRELETEINSNQVEKDATDLYEAGEKSWGTDESRFIDIFTKRSLTHLRAVFEHYKKISGNDIVNALDSEMDGHLLAALVALVSSARDPPTYYAGLAKQTVKDSSKDFTRLIVERCEIDTEEIKDVYLSVYKKKIAEDIAENYDGFLQRILLGLLNEPWEKLPEDSSTKEKNRSDTSDKKKPNIITVDKPIYHGTIKPAVTFNPKDCAEKLRKAMEGFGTDEKTIIEVLSSASRGQRRIISDTYQQEFGKNLLEELKSELGGDMENLVVAMMLPIDVLYAKELEKAMKGFGSDEEALLEIICSQTSESLEAIANSFKKESGKDLNDAIDQELKGDIGHLVQALLLSGHFNANEVDLNEVESVASEVSKAETNRWEGENAIIINILRTKSRSFMVEMFKAFHQVANCDIVETITKDTSGTYRDMLIATVDSIRHLPSYLAKRLHNALDRLNVDDDTLIRCVVGRSEIDLVEIKQAYQEIFSVSLETTIERKCRGKYETMLVSVVRGN